MLSGSTRALEACRSAPELACISMNLISFASGSRPAASRRPRPARLPAQTPRNSFGALIHDNLPTYRSLGCTLHVRQAVKSSPAPPPGSSPSGLPGHVAGRPGRRARHAEGLALPSHRGEADLLWDGDRKARPLPRRAGRGARGRGRAPSGSGSRSVATLPWSPGSSTSRPSLSANGASSRRAARGLVGERRRYEERIRELFREGARSVCSAPTSMSPTAALLALSAVNWAYTWLRPGSTPMSSPTDSSRSSSMGCVATPPPEQPSGSRAAHVPSAPLAQQPRTPAPRRAVASTPSLERRSTSVRRRRLAVVSVGQRRRRVVAPERASGRCGRRTRTFDRRAGRTAAHAASRRLGVAASAGTGGRRTPRRQVVGARGELGGTARRARVTLAADGVLIVNPFDAVTGEARRVRRASGRAAVGSPSAGACDRARRATRRRSTRSSFPGDGTQRGAERRGDVPIGFLPAAARASPARSGCRDPKRPRASLAFVGARRITSAS